MRTRNSNRPRRTGLGWLAAVLVTVSALADADGQRQGIPLAVHRTPIDLEIVIHVPGYSEVRMSFEEFAQDSGLSAAERNELLSSLKSKGTFEGAGYMIEPARP